MMKGPKDDRPMLDVNKVHLKIKVFETVIDLRNDKVSELFI